jgi:hypothetical protein
LILDDELKSEENACIENLYFRHHEALCDGTDRTIGAEGANRADGADGVDRADGADRTKGSMEPRDQGG